MPERSTVTQAVQIGVETTPGTSVAANKSLQSLMIEPELHFDIQRFQPTGKKYPTIIVPGKEWAEATIRGVASYSEIVYLLNGLVSAHAGVQNGATTAYTWTAGSSNTNPDTVKTFTIERGDANFAQKFSYAVFSEGAWTFNRGGTTFEGKVFGQVISDGITMTASPTAIEEKPVIPNQVDVYVDATSGALGGTKMTRVFETKISIQNRFGPVWVLNSALGSFAVHVELVPTVQVELKMEADAQGMALLPIVRGGTTQFIRIKCTSPDLAGTAFPYSITFDTAGKISNAGTYSDEDGIYAMTWTFDTIFDATWGKAMQWTTVNKQVTL